MKKLLIASTILLGAQLASATTLYVTNLTGRPMMVAVTGSEFNYNSRNAKTLNGSINKKTGKPNKHSISFFNWGSLGGQLRFAFLDEVGKNGYPVWESFNAKTNKDYKKLSAGQKRTWKANKNLDALPVAWALVAKIEISNDRSENYKFAGKKHKRPVVRRTYPGLIPSAWKQLNMIRTKKPEYGKAVEAEW